MPASSTLQQAEQQGHGTVNFTVMAVSGSDLTAEGIPAPIDVSPAAVNAAQLATQAAGIVQMPTFSAFRPMTATQAAAIKASNSAAPDSAATSAADAAATPARLIRRFQAGRSQAVILALILMISSSGRFTRVVIRRIRYGCHIAKKDGAI